MVEEGREEVEVGLEEVEVVEVVAGGSEVG